MGTSHPESREWSVSKILASSPKRILDVGAGSGTYYNALKKYRYRGVIDAVEVWEPYINEFNLRSKYHNVFNEDIRTFDDFDYDVVIFGDILEHMSKQEALDLWARVALEASHALVAIPIIHYHQGELNGNPYEAHIKDDWSHEEVMDTFPGIADAWQGTVVGAYWANFR